MARKTQRIGISSNNFMKQVILCNITFNIMLYGVDFMEVQEYTCCCEKKKKCRKISCLGLVAAILSVLFFFVLGLIIGAVVSATILGALAAIIVLAIVLLILLILTLIVLTCKCRNRKHEEY